MHGFSRDQSRHNASMTQTMAKYYKTYPEEEVKPDFFSYIPVLENGLHVWVFCNYSWDRSRIHETVQLILVKKLVKDYRQFVRDNSMLDNFCRIENRLQKMFPDRIKKIGEDLYFIYV